MNETVDPASPQELVAATLAATEQVDSLPLADHVAVFEKAHEQLRSALDAPRS
ncbi:hypothetical protein ACLM5J_18110 [Nocardioides sp. Bht2]|uniref:hypothetical protein n=1 Tax=Nocardioides sp. Bht2 TaxID=3392297 RepID=UPI0039B4EDB2